MSFKTIHITHESSEAEVIKVQLAEVGITAILLDTLSAQVTGVPLQVGGIKVQVEENQMEQALQLLIELGYTSEEQLKKASETVVSIAQVNKFNKGLKIALAILVISLVALFFVS